MRYNKDYFELVNKRGSVTASDMVEKFGVSRQTAATWLSRNVRAGYLTKKQGSRRRGSEAEEVESTYSIKPGEKMEKIANVFI